MSRKQIIVTIVVIISLLIIGGVVYALIPKATLHFAVAPEEVKIKINGDTHSIKNGTSMTVGPGEITIEVFRDEFESYTETFTIENGKSHEVLVALNPLTEAARALLDNPTSTQVIERVGGKKVREGADQLNKEYPILKELPIKDRFYNIATCDSVQYPDDKTRFAICVQLFDLQARQSAIDDIESRGYSISDYEVIFVDFTYENLQEEAGE